MSDKPIPAVEQLFDLIRRGHSTEARGMCEDNTSLINQLGVGTNTALHWSAREGLIDLTKYLVTNGANINSKNSTNDTPLHNAAWKSQDEIVQYLLSLPNIQIDVKNSMNQTPAELANNSTIKHLFEEYSLRNSTSHIRQVVEDDDDSD